MSSSTITPSVSNSIWEQMVTEERRQLASQLGVRVSDLEEQQNLLLTIAQSRVDSRQNISTDENISLTSYNDNNPSHSNTLEAIVEGVEQEDVDDVIHIINNTMSELSLSTSTSVDFSVHMNAEIDKKGGPWYRLPQVLVDTILTYVGDPDSIGYIMLASKVTFQPTERIFKFICEQIYPRQTTKKVCRIDRWGTWKNMLINRPRLRLNGIYTLRTMYSKGYCNDAFWEEKRHESVEVKYFRHFRFFNDGRVLYSLDVVEPYEMVKLLERGEPIPKRVFAGNYQLQRNELHVRVQLHYCEMDFELLLLDGDDGFVGKHNMLTLKSHTSHVIGGQANRRLQIENVHHPIPVFHDFRFYRFWQLRPDPPNPALFPELF